MHTHNSWSNSVVRRSYIHAMVYTCETSSCNFQGNGCNLKKQQLLLAVSHDSRTVTFNKIAVTINWTAETFTNTAVTLDLVAVTVNGIAAICLRMAAISVKQFNLFK